MGGWQRVEKGGAEELLRWERPSLKNLDKRDEDQARLRNTKKRGIRKIIKGEKTSNGASECAQKRGSNERINKKKGNHDLNWGG